MSKILIWTTAGSLWRPASSFQKLSPLHSSSVLSCLICMKSKSDALYGYMWSILHHCYKVPNSTFYKFSAMMRTLLLLVPLLGAVRSDGECNGVRKEYDQCTMQWVLLKYHYLPPHNYHHHHHLHQQWPSSSSSSESSSSSFMQCNVRLNLLLSERIRPMWQRWSVWMTGDQISGGAFLFVFFLLHCYSIDVNGGRPNFRSRFYLIFPFHWHSNYGRLNSRWWIFIWWSSWSWSWG